MFCKLLSKWMILEYKCINSRFSTACKEQWDLVSSVCLERKPIITKDLTDFDSKYSEVLSKTEFEMSHKSDHEIRVIKDKFHAEELKKDGSFFDSDVVGLQTAQEFEDQCNEELTNFTFGKRITDEDLKNDVTSSNRKLSDSLLLIVKQNIGQKSKWVLPQGIRHQGETMRQAAERVLGEICGHNLHTKFLGNAPCGFYKFRYPKKVANNTPSVGMKIFFFKAQLIEGSVSKDICADFQWLTHKELNPSTLQEDYLKSVKMFLIENEEHSSKQLVQKFVLSH